MAVDRSHNMLYYVTGQTFWNTRSRWPCSGRLQTNPAMGSTRRGRPDSRHPGGCGGRLFSSQLFESLFLGLGSIPSHLSLELRLPAEVLVDECLLSVREVLVTDAEED